MYYFQSDKILTVLAPAKLNLFFEVHGKRSDGFHEITSLAVPIRLFDMLTFEIEPQLDNGKIKFSCLGGKEDVPQDADNIVVRALEMFRKRYGITQGIKVNLFKRIPSQSGLGGGSSDAASALFAAHKLWLPSISITDLIPLAAEIGSDCPLFLYNNAVIARGRGEKIETVTRMPKLYFVLFKPADGLSTAAVYAKCMKTHDKKFRDVLEISKSLEKGDLIQIGKQLFNRLEYTASEIWSRFNEIKCRLEQFDCITVRMSGSGTAFYGLCRNAKHSRHVAAKLRHCLSENETVYNVES
ncbi:MAG: 4-(cytidine 5'-diphospho)-2-C-methyl-D-erythritol kinase [Planctomycetaceae bacterium]|jgi:4-diphosphocytidyl-2-C-methyl-D-erythritol kinase|nr:4-(cytidine 5'-diphospho)-2-C-methyl-D-erythritol kinase [Planctomycetaceae bacterium]